MIPRFPRMAARLAGVVPLFAVTSILSKIGEATIRRHPALFARLGPHGRSAFLIDPIDLPFVILLRPSQSAARFAAIRRGTAQWDARIAGPLAAFLGMVHGRLDGDALFFSRDLVIEGDTAAVLALRNAIDDAELDLADAAIGAMGPLRAIGAPPLQALLPLLERASGVSLSRAGLRKAE